MSKNRQKNGDSLKASNKKQAKSLQYTVRGISLTLDALLREKAKKANLSLNDVTLRAIQKGVGNYETNYDDLDHLVNTWVEDLEFDKAIQEQRKIDADLWA